MADETMAAPSITPWVDKYRPKQIQDVSHQEEVVATLEKALQSSNMPHLLFHGPPGTGKTTTALAISRQLYGPELSKTRVMELNASDERGISVVRDKIKAFASTSVGRPIDGFPCPPYKLLILDEADSMTQDAQNALRRTMEAHSKVTRFIFCCNYVSRIIEPLASRCAKFRFKPLHGAVMQARITYICENEEVELADGALETLAKVSRGDLRRAITSLQSAYRLKGSPVQPSTLLDVSGAVPEMVVNKLLQACKTPKFDQVQAAVTESIADGWPVQHILLETQEACLKNQSISDKQRAIICTCLADSDKALVDGADEALQLLNVASSIQQILNAK